MKKRLSPLSLVSLGACILAALLILTHRQGAIVSFDEGFHGGAALYLQEVIRFFLGQEPRPDYLFGEFRNGVVLYPHTWTIVATFLGFVFGSTTAVFRFATSLFYIATVIGSYWFIRKSGHSERAAIASAAMLATVPMVMIYSHLMMLEVPLLLGVGFMVGSIYLLSEGKLKRDRRTILFLTLGFILSTHTKLPAWPVAWAIILGYAVLSSLFFYRDHTYKRFLKPEILLFFFASFTSLIVFILFENRFFDANMVEFFLDQSQGGGKANPLMHALELAWMRKSFYLRDFAHIPFLATVWFGSVAAYALWKRTRLSLLFVLWTFITYATFSGVNPQVPQYIMPIYAPLAFATALLLIDIGELRIIKRASSLIPAALIIGVILLQVGSLKKSEAYGWRAQVTGQEDAVQLMMKSAKEGDRVLSWHDGDSYVIREAGLRKKLQITSAANQLCPQAMVGSYDWALVVNQPPQISDIDKAILTTAPWKEIGRFGEDKTTILYHNERPSLPLTIETEEFKAERRVSDTEAGNSTALLVKESFEQPAFWGCLRLLPYGKLQAEFRIKSVTIPSSVSDETGIMRIEYSGYPSGEDSGRVILAKELRHAGPGYQSFIIPLDHTKVNVRGEFRIVVYNPITAHVDSIIINRPQ